MSAALFAVAAPERETLYEIESHLTVLYEAADSCILPEDRAECERVIALYLEAEIGKVDSVAGYLAFCELQQEFADAEIKRLQARVKRYGRYYERTAACVLVAMKIAKLTRLEGRTATLAARKCPVSVDVFDEQVVPADFRVEKVTESISRIAIKAAIQCGRMVPGARLVTDRKRLQRS